MVLCRTKKFGIRNEIFFRISLQILCIWLSPFQPLKEVVVALTTSRAYPLNSATVVRLMLKSWSICEMKVVRIAGSVTPGEILLEEFLVPMGISWNQLAKEIGVSPRRVEEIIKEARAITVDIDLRLARFFGLSDGYWLRARVYEEQLSLAARVQEFTI